MVAIDQYNSKVRSTPLAGVLRIVSGVRLRDILRVPTFLFRRTEAEVLAKRLREADRISATAGLPTTLPMVEPAQLDAAAIVERLTQKDVSTSATSGDIEHATEQAYVRLDRIEYDLATMWDEIAPYMEGANVGSKTGHSNG